MQQRWLATGLKEVGVEIWFGDHGSGWIELYELKNDAFVSLAHNPSPDQPLLTMLLPKTGVRDMSVKTIGASVSGTDLPLWISVGQNGLILPADDGMGHPLNGSGPFTSLSFSDKAKHNNPSYFYFAIKFG